MLSKKLQGTGVALVTPFKQNNSVDYDALEKIIDFTIAGKIEYFVILGTTGETPTLSADEKKEIILFTYEKVNGRVPIVVGIGGNNTQSLKEDLARYPLDKATAVLSASPAYSKPSQEGLFQHYKALAAASPKPLLLYNVPSRTGSNLNIVTVVRLANEVENIIGIKEATENMNQCMELVQKCPNTFSIISGDDALSMSQIACGFDGLISVAANAYPQEVSDMIRFARQYNFTAAQKIQYSLLNKYAMMFEENNPAGIKAFLFEKGLMQNRLRLPLVIVNKNLQERIQKTVGKG